MSVHCRSPDPRRPGWVSSVPFRPAVVAARGERVQEYRPGDGLDPSTRMGPVVSEAQLAKNLRAVEAAVREGGTLRSDPAVDRQFFAPAVVDGLDRRSSAAREEIFGPVVA